MARPSSTERPYLSLGPTLATTFIFENSRLTSPCLSWGTSPGPGRRSLIRSHGRSIIKVSLKTSDLAIAQDRWLEVHNQSRSALSVRANCSTQLGSRGVVATSLRCGWNCPRMNLLCWPSRCATTFLSDCDQRWKDRQHLSPTARATWLASRRSCPRRRRASAARSRQWSLWCRRR